MKKEKFEAKDSSNKVFLTINVSYPYFKGNSVVEKKLNKEYKEEVSQLKSMTKEFTDLKDLGIEDFKQTVDVKCKIVCNQKGVLSIREDIISSINGIGEEDDLVETRNYDLYTGKEIELKNIAKSSELDKAISIALKKKEAPTSKEELEEEIEEIKESEFTLSAKGVCFYYYGFDGEESSVETLVIPYPNTSTYKARFK
ncbi:hypothetical protein P261_00296 [Lachnospiraceae bacterium TWA4]|nr:hypothetical protein P261_00296 [Lachnospiraceae bacterium TWA4]